MALIHQRFLFWFLTILFPFSASKEKKEEVENTSTAALKSNSVASAGDEVESDQQAKMETSLPIWEAKSEGASELQKEEANPSELGRYKREDKFEFDLMVRIRVPIFQLHFHWYKIMLYNFLEE